MDVYKCIDVHKYIIDPYDFGQTDAGGLIITLCVLITYITRIKIIAKTFGWTLTLITLFGEFFVFAVLKYAFDITYSFLIGGIVNLYSIIGGIFTAIGFFMIIKAEINNARNSQSQAKASSIS